MTQKRWHWTDTTPNYLANHIRLQVNADEVRVELFASDPSGGDGGAPVSPVNRIILERATMAQTIGGLNGPTLLAFAAIDARGLPRPPISVLAESTVTRRPPRHTRAGRGECWPVMMALSHPELPFTEASFLVRSAAGFSFSSNLEDWEELDAEPPGGATGGILGTLPTIALEHHAVSIPVGGETSLGLRIVDAAGVLDPRCVHTVHLEETGGFVPLRRVMTTDGLASFRISALGMAAGDVFKVKAGFRHFSGCDEVLVTVV